MDLDTHYLTLHHTAIQQIHSGGFELDTQLENDDDSRRGLTLLLRPSREVKKNIKEFLLEVEADNPGQYLYPESDLHITVMPVISCYEGFDISRTVAQKYFTVIENAIRDIKKAEIFFQGVIFSPSCIMVKGFPLNDSLNIFRDNLRKIFTDTDLEQSLDKRYKLVTAHSTVVRFKKPVRCPEKLMALVDRYKDRVFGRTVFDHVDFVFNDWYQREENVRILKRFEFED